MTLRIVLHRQIPEDSKLQREWDALVLQMDPPEVFYTWGWAQAMQAAYQSSLTPLLFLGYEGDDLAGVASLATERSEENATFLAGTTADYCDFLSRPGRRAEFIDAVLTELRKTNVRFLALASLPENSATLAALHSAAAEHGYFVYKRPACLSTLVELGGKEEREKLRAGLSGYRKLRRHIRAMEREGPVKFVHLQSMEQVQAALPGFADAHVARFRATQRTSFLETPERRLFLAELARRFSGTGVVTLSMLTIAESPVAWIYGFQFNGCWFIYQPTFDSRQQEHSPGHCLLSTIMLEACDRDDMRVVDLGIGAEGYKERFGNRTRQTLYVTVTKSWSRHLREVARYRGATVLKQSPKVESIVRRVLGRSPATKG